jgi:hypothetical protein
VQQLFAVGFGLFHAGGNALLKDLRLFDFVLQLPQLTAGVRVVVLERLQLGASTFRLGARLVVGFGVFGTLGVGFHEIVGDSFDLGLVLGLLRVDVCKKSNVRGLFAETNTQSLTNDELLQTLQLGLLALHLLAAALQILLRLLNLLAIQLHHAELFLFLGQPTFDGRAFITKRVTLAHEFGVTVREKLGFIPEIC